MKVLIDGKPVKALTDVKVIHEEQTACDPDGHLVEDAELHLTLTHEGMVIDVIRGGEVVATVPWTLEQLVGCAQVGRTCGGCCQPFEGWAPAEDD